MDFGDLLSQTAIQAWAISSIVVALKTILAGNYTSILRMRKQVFISPEDYKMRGGKGEIRPRSGHRALPARPSE